MDLHGRHLLVTGAARRVGRAICEGWLARAGKGLKLTAHYHRSKTEVDELAARGKKAGAEVFPISADLRDVTAVRAMAAAAEKRFGPVDVLVNSASDFFPTPAESVTEDQWDSLFDLNLKSQFFLAQALGKAMRGRGGVILNIADVNGERGIRNYAPYAATKAGLIHLTRCLAKEWAPRVRVNAISPGAVLFPESYSEEQKERAVSKALLQRPGAPEDIAQAVLFLVGNDYITGQVLNVDGGRSIA